MQHFTALLSIKGPGVLCVDFTEGKLGLQEEQRLAGSRQAKEAADQQLREKAEAAKAITGSVDLVSHSLSTEPE